MTSEPVGGTAFLREVAADLAALAPIIETPYGAGRPLTYDLSVHGLRWAADEIDRLRDRLRRILERAEAGQPGQLLIIAAIAEAALAVPASSDVLSATPE